MLQKALEVLRLHDSTSIDLRLSLLLIGLIYFVHSYLRRRRQHEVSIFACTYVEVLSSLSQEDIILSQRYGCLPMKARFPCQWPLGLDVLYAQYNAIQENHLLAFQQRFLDGLGPNLEIKIFGSVGYTTFDPENVEAVLSSRFEGACFAVMTKGDKGFDSPIADYFLGSRRGA